MGVFTECVESSLAPRDVTTEFSRVELSVLPLELGHCLMISRGVQEKSLEGGLWLVIDFLELAPVAGLG